VVQTADAAGSPPGHGTPAEWSDAELVRACLEGEQRAWSELVVRYGGLVFSITRRRGLSQVDAEDVFQQVFALMHRKLHHLRDVARLPAWLISITLRECRRYRRRMMRFEALPMVDIEHAPTDEVGAWERRQLVREALRQLGGPGERLLTALFFNPGTPNYRQIAETLGTCPGSIGPTRARCFRKLETILNGMGFEELGSPPAPAQRRRRLAG
jgi:RNA polymerase sigma factor (sigma-70 family)